MLNFHVIFCGERRAEMVINRQNRQNRLMITVSDENLRRLEWVYKKFGVTKSSQIQSLIAKYLENEYGRIENLSVQRGESNAK